MQAEVAHFTELVEQLQRRDAALSEQARRAEAELAATKELRSAPARAYDDRA